jgi:hypothetical protein
VYFGEMENEKSNIGKGRGIQILSNKQVQMGYWEKNLLNGEARICIKDGGCFEGEFRANKVHGLGVKYSKNGDKLKINWTNSKPDGIGTKHKNGKEYKVEFKNGEKVK